MNKTGNEWMAAAAAVTAAAVSTWGWAPQGWWPLVPLAFGLLLHAVERARGLWGAWWLGWVFGATSQLVGHRWMYNAMTTKVSMDRLEAALQFGALGMYLGLSTGVATVAWKALHRPHRQNGGLRNLLFSAISFAVLITLAEIARSVSFGGFSSLSVGYAFLDTWMRGYMPIGGVWFASFAVLLVTALACRVPWLASRGRQALASLAAAGIVALGAGLAHITWVQPSGRPLTYRLLQPNVAQDLKFDPSQTTQQLDALTRQLESGSADIILSPETAVPLFLTQLPAGLIERWQALSVAGKSHLFVGLPMLNETGLAHNALLHISPETQSLASYHKARLMPFGEYTPKGLEWTTRDLALPLKDLVPGSRDQAALKGPGPQAIAVLMCQEELMGEDARRGAIQAGVLLNPSNLAWFDDSAAIAQRLQIVRVRALETGRPILRSANTGITSHIDHIGQVASSAPERRSVTLSGRIQPMQGRTPYVVLGDWLFLGVATGWLCIRAAVTIRFKSIADHP